MADWLNRGARRIDRAATERVRYRLESRAPVTLPELFNGTGLPPACHAGATILLTNLGTILETNPEHLRAEDRLGELLRVDARELPSISLRDWRGARLDQYIVIHTYDIMHLVETFADGSKWKQKWESLPSPPRNEEQWIDLILGMSVREFVEFFAPLAKTT